MRDEAPRIKPLHPLPPLVQSEAEYRRVVWRLVEISEGSGNKPYETEFDELLLRAKQWEKRTKR